MKNKKFYWKREDQIFLTYYIIGLILSIFFTINFSIYWIIFVLIFLFMVCLGISVYLDRDIRIESKGGKK